MFSEDTVSICFSQSDDGGFHSKRLPGVECLDCFQLSWGLKYLGIACFSSVQIYECWPLGGCPLVLERIAHMRMAPTTHALYPTFSPCGSWLAFCSDIPGSGGHCVVCQADNLPNHLSSMSALAAAPGCMGSPTGRHASDRGRGPCMAAMQCGCPCPALRLPDLGLAC